jgi:hypothetical protein
MVAESRSPLEILKTYPIIIVEGWDCVGKSTLIERLRGTLKAEVYRPNYIYWQSHNLPKSYRWVIGAGFLDVLSTGNVKLSSPLLIDRGILSGMVYNDPSIGKGYRELLRRLPYPVLHLIVTTDEASYLKMLEVRGEDVGDYATIHQKTKDFLSFASLLDIDYLLLSNSYDQDYADLVKGKCVSCRHYSYGFCNNPSVSPVPLAVPPEKDQCEFSHSEEVQGR